MKGLLQSTIAVFLHLTFLPHIRGIIIEGERGESIHGIDIEPLAQRQLITNGTRVDPGTYPFYAYNKYGQGSGCGASLIHEDILLSAAHCRQVYDGRGAYVGAATNYGYDDGPDIFHEDDLVMLHPRFDPMSYHNDIMLVKLQTPSSQALVELNRDGDLPAPGTPLTVMGFGDTTFKGNLSPNLLQAEVSVHDFDKCMQVFSAESVVLDPEIQFCGLDETGSGQDSCEGDSGSPIINELGVQVGLVSFGLGCGSVGVPAIYTRISPYIDWIDEHVCLLSANPPERCRNNTDDAIGYNNTSSHNDTSIGETNITEAVCDPGSDCSIRCDYAMNAVETCFSNLPHSNDTTAGGLDACMACTRLENATSPLYLGFITPQDYIDQACSNIGACEDDCGVCFGAAVEFGWCAWDCDLDASRFNTTGWPSEFPLANATNETAQSIPPSSVSIPTPSPWSDTPSMAPSLFSNNTDLEGSNNSSNSLSLEPSASPFTPTHEPTTMSNIFDRPVSTVSPTTTARIATFIESITIVLHGVKGPLDDEQLTAFEQATEAFLKLAGDTTVQVDYMDKSFQIDNDGKMIWQLTASVSSTQNDHPGVAAVDAIARSQQSLLNYIRVLREQDDAFLDVFHVEARLTSDIPAVTTAPPKSNDSNGDDSDDSIDDALWYAIGMLGLAILVAVLVTIKFVRALRAVRNGRDCEESEAHFYDRDDYVSDDDAKVMPETFDDEFDPAQDHVRRM